MPTRTHRIAIRLGAALVLPLIAFTYRRAAAHEGSAPAPILRECADSLSTDPAVWGKVGELFRFLIFDHPIQKDFVLRERAEQILFLLHWSTGFRFPSEPNRHHPGDENFNVVGKTERSLREVVRWRPFSPTPADYLRVRRVNDRFPRYLLRAQWPAASLIQDADDAMEARYWEFSEIADVGNWERMPIGQRDAYINNILFGLLEGASLLNTFAITKQIFFSDLRDIQYAFYQTSIVIREQMKKLMSYLDEPIVVQSLSLVLREHLPEVVARKNDFRLRSHTEPDRGGGDNIVLARALKRVDLEEFRRYFLRDTKTLTRLRQIAAEITKGKTEAKRAGLPKPVSVERAEVSASSALDDLEQYWLDGGTRRKKEGLTTTREHLDAGRAAEHDCSTIVEHLLRLDSLPEKQSLREWVDSMREDSLTSPSWAEVDRLFQKLRAAEDEFRRELRLVTLFQSLSRLNQDTIDRAIRFFDSTLNPSVPPPPGELGEAAHLQSVLVTFTPLTGLLRARSEKIERALAVVRGAARTLYAARLAQAAGERVEVLPILQSLGEAL